MVHHHAMSDADLRRVEHLLPGRPGQRGGGARDNRRFLDAVLWVARTGDCLDRPAGAAGQGDQPVAAVRPLGQGALGPDPRGAAQPGPGPPDPRLHRRPSRRVRRRGEKKWDGSGGQAEQALGRRRVGFGAKVHMSCDGLGRPVDLLLTPAQESDIAQAEALLAEHRPEEVIADRGYDKRALVERIEPRGARAVIPTQRTRKEQRAVVRHAYRERNVRERFWSKAKRYRRVATRYEKKAANYLAFVKVAAKMVMLL